MTSDDDRPPADNDAFMAWLKKVPDPERRYTIATSALEEHQKVVRELSALRAEAVADAAEDEDSISAVARKFGVSRQRAHQLVNEARARGPATAPPKKKGGRSRRKEGQ